LLSTAVFPSPPLYQDLLSNEPSHSLTWRVYTIRTRAKLAAPALGKLQKLCHTHHSMASLSYLLPLRLRGSQLQATWSRQAKHSIIFY
jgi:hypothetical protein